MRNKKGSIIILLGFLSIIFNSIEELIKSTPSFLIISFLLLLYTAYRDKQQNTHFLKYLLPFSAGILSFLMRLFYIDKFDYAKRLNSLIVILLVFSILYFLYNEKIYLKFIEKFNLFSLKKRIILIFVFTQIIFLFSSYTIVRKGIILIGDEPHYLAISHSIAKDFDINVFNQYARNEYRDFIDYRLQSHAKEGKGFKKWYSIHLPGLSLTLAPFLLFKFPLPVLYFLLRAFIGLFGSGIAILIYLFSITLLKKSKLPLFITIVFTLTTPVFFMSIHIFAEIQALFLILLSLYLILFSEGKKRIKLRLILSGFFMGITVFWGLKYLLFILFYLAGFGIYFFIKKKFKNILMISFLPVIFLIIFAKFLLFAYGSLSPTAVYTGLISATEKAELVKNTKMIPLSHRIETLLDYFFDQRDGLIPYNPIYLFFFPGLLLAFIKIKKYYPHILISSAGFVYILYHGYSTIRAGYCPQARYLTPVIWILMLFSIIYYLETKNRLLKKILLITPLYSFSVVLYQLFNPYTIYQQTTHDSFIRSGLFFQKISNIYFDISKFLPSFAKIEGNFKYLPNIVLFILLIIFLIFSIKKTKENGFKSIYISAFSIVFVIASLFPQLPLYNPIKVIKEKDNSIPFIFYSNRNPSNRKYPSGFATIEGNGKYKFYLSIPHHNIKRGKNIAMKIIFNKVRSAFKLKIYNYDDLKFNTEINRNKNTIILDHIKIKKINNKFMIIITMDVIHNKNKNINLNLFFYNDKLRNM